MPHKIVRSTIFAAALGSLAGPALAHHSFGQFDMGVAKHWSGTLTEIHLINPHSYMEIDVVDEYGKRSHIRCEMRAAGLMRRSGWSPEMFKVGMHIEVDGHPHRTDPNACYTENFKLGDAPMVNRNDQFSIARNARCASPMASRTSVATGPWSNSCSPFPRAAATAP